MPKYPFYCKECDVELHITTTVRKRDEQACPDCDGALERLFAKTMEPTIMETVDKHRNVKWRDNQDARIRKRAKDFFIENEMPDLIAKHGKEHARRAGWIKKDGKVLKKEDLK